jgi:hypothetical protein
VLLIQECYWVIALIILKKGVFMKIPKKLYGLVAGLAIFLVMPFSQSKIYVLGIFESPQEIQRLVVSILEKAGINSEKIKSGSRQLFEEEKANPRAGASAIILLDPSFSYKPDDFNDLNQSDIILYVFDRGRNQSDIVAMDPSLFSGINLAHSTSKCAT